MTLPPVVRKIQQSWTFHLVIAALICGGGVMFVCFGQKSEITWECVKGGLLAAGSYLIATAQHSPGSASFTPNGEVNQPVLHVVEMQTEGIPVKVVAGK